MNVVAPLSVAERVAMLLYGVMEYWRQAGRSTRLGRGPLYRIVAWGKPESQLGSIHAFHPVSWERSNQSNTDKRDSYSKGEEPESMVGSAQRRHMRKGDKKTLEAVTVGR